MAEISDLVFASISSYTRRKINDAIIERNVLLNWMRDKGTLKYRKGGLDLVDTVRREDSLIAGYTSDVGTGSAQTTQTTTEAKSQWRQFIARLFILGFQRDRNEAGNDFTTIFRMAKYQLDEVKQSAMSRIGRALYATNVTTEPQDDGTPIDGLGDIIDDANIYRGIDRSTEAYWRAQLLAVPSPYFDPAYPSGPASNNITNFLKTMDDLYLQCSEGYAPVIDGVKTDVADMKAEPEIEITTQEGYNIYKHSLQPQQRYHGRTGSDLTSLMHGRASVEWDPACPAKTLFMLNSDYIEFLNVYDALIKTMQPIRTSSPLGEEYPIIGQHAMKSNNPRYLGKLTWTT